MIQEYRSLLRRIFESYNNSFDLNGSTCRVPRSQSTLVLSLYPDALEERRIVVADLSNTGVPSNYKEVQTAINVDPPDNMTPEAAEEAHNLLIEGTASEVEVLGVIAHDIPCFRKMRQVTRDRRAKLQCSSESTYPIPSRYKLPRTHISPSNPDMVIGYNFKKMDDYSSALLYLNDQCTPINADKLLIFPVVTVEVKGDQAEDYSKRQNRLNTAVMLRNLRTLRQTAGMTDEELKRNFDGTAHVIMINFTKAVISIYCGWTIIGDDDEVAYYIKELASHKKSEGWKSFHTMVGKILNAVDWAMTTNKEWIWNDMKAADSIVDNLAPLGPAYSVIRSAHSEQQSINL